MRSLYITSDQIGTKSGGGRVTLEEYKALELLGRVDPFDRARVGDFADPFEFDQKCCEMLKSFAGLGELKEIKLAHFYAGTFTQTIAFLQSCGIKVSYTCAAHDRHLSAKEHEATWGQPYNIPHMQDGPLWERYVEGYRRADLLITPSEYSRRLMIGYGCLAAKAVVVPHGHDPVSEIPPMPKRFTVGYMGSAGSDKGLRYLLEAWKRVDLKDSQLLLAGPYNQIGLLQSLIRTFGGGNVRCLGYVPTLEEFYQQISVYCQVSSTEGFGIEILEAMAHGRPVVASKNAGGSECLASGDPLRIEPCSVDAIADTLSALSKQSPKDLAVIGESNASIAKFYTWGRAANQYTRHWVNLIGPAFKRDSLTIAIGGERLTIPERLENLDWSSDKEVIDKYWNPKSGDVCIDVGCGPGIWSLVAAKKGADAFAYDPRTVAHDIVTAVAKANGIDGRIHQRTCGVWSKSGSLNFSESSFMWETNGSSSLVKVCSLDEELKSGLFGRVDFLNVDAEGSELFVLEGAAEILKRFRPRVLVDVHSNVSLKDLEKRLAPLGSYALDFIDKYVIVTPR